MTEKKREKKWVEVGAEHCHTAGCNCKAGQQNMFREHAVNLNAFGTKKETVLQSDRNIIDNYVCASPRLKDKLGV